MNRILVKAVVDALTFIGLTDAGHLDEDLSERQLEDLIADLKALDAPDTAEFCSLVLEIAQEKELSGIDASVVRFIREIPANFD